MSDGLLETNARLFGDAHRDVNQPFQDWLLDRPAITALEEVPQNVCGILSAGVRGGGRRTVQKHAVVVFRKFAEAAVGWTFERDLFDFGIQVSFALEWRGLRNNFKSENRPSFLQLQILFDGDRFAIVPTQLAPLDFLAVDAHDKFGGMDRGFL